MFRRLTNQQLLSPAITAAVRRRLDDSRYHLVQGLMTVLPYKFDEHALMCDFDRIGDFFNWFAFVDQVNSIFNSCHSWSKYNGVFYRYQRYPILSMCYPDQLLQTKGVELPFVPVICPGVLTSHPVYLEENHFHVIDKLTQDDVAL